MNPSDRTTATGSPPARLRRNIELKARLAALDEARSVARRLATEPVMIQDQVDTYFYCPNGRLKLREINQQQAQLIWYARADQPQARQSDYYLLDVPEPLATKQLLTAASGVRRVVLKRREIYLVDNVRIHLDDVVGLGCFLEFEAVLSATDDTEKGHRQLASLQGEFGITPADILTHSYGEMA